MMRIAIFVLLCLCTAGPAWAETYTVDATAWQKPRSAAMVKALPGVNAAVQALLKAPDKQLIIRHQKGEEGILWGAELHDWLVSLGIPPARMRVEAAEVGPAAMQLEVLSNTVKGSSSKSP